MMEMLVGTNRKGELKRVVQDMPHDQFVHLLEEVTRESRQFLDTMQLANSEAFESMLDQAVEAFTFKLSRVVGCERASLFLVDADRGDLWLKVAEEEGGKPVELRMPIGTGIAGHVASTGVGVRVDDAYQDPRFNPQADRETGFRTRTILCLPIRSGDGRVFGVSQLLNRCDGKPFDAADEARFADFTSSIGVILETWWRMQKRRASA
ncbi:MAG: GAF domain-containing protein [Planctomycetota bacterium]